MSLGQSLKSRIPPIQPMSDCLSEYDKSLHLPLYSAKYQAINRLLIANNYYYLLINWSIKL